MGVRLHQDLGVACLLDWHPPPLYRKSHQRLTWVNPSGIPPYLEWFPPASAPRQSPLSAVPHQPRA